MADLHLDDAARLGITQEDPIDLFTERGSIRVLANLTARILPGTVAMYHGYSEADVNSITDPDHLDPYSGFPGVRSLRVGVRRAPVKGGEG
jgi:anaerobic selenocysteine-containing dehydrogenase